MPLSVLGTCCAQGCGHPPVVDCRTANGYGEWLCEFHLNMWLDNADDDDTLEPVALTWLSCPASVA